MEVAMLRTDFGCGRGATSSRMERTRKVTATMIVAAEAARWAGGQNFGSGEVREGGSKYLTLRLRGQLWIRIRLNCLALRVDCRIKKVIAGCAVAAADTGTTCGLHSFQLDEKLKEWRFARS
jgi:hypothetical protein